MSTEATKPKKARVTREQRLSEAFRLNPSALVAVRGVELAGKLAEVLNEESDASVKAFALNLLSQPPIEPPAIEPPSHPCPTNDTKDATTLAALASVAGATNPLNP